jgi:hypothetical protein
VPAGRAITWLRLVLFSNPRHSVFAEMCRISRRFARLSLIEVPNQTGL